MPLNRYVVRVDPQGKPMAVDILDMTGTSVPAFESSQFAAAQLSLPLTISGPTDFWLQAPGPYDVSCKVATTEIASASGPQRVQVSDVPVLVVPPWEVLAPSSSGGSGVAPASASTTETITLGDGGATITNVFVAGKPALAIAIDGDPFPRYVIMANAGDGIYMGDGQTDPTAESGVACNVFMSAAGFGIYAAAGHVQIEAANGLILTADSGNIVLNGLPTADPVSGGALWNNSGVLNVSSG